VLELHGELRCGQQDVEEALRRPPPGATKIVVLAKFGCPAAAATNDGSPEESPSVFHPLDAEDTMGF
jgi:hypothetical protein